MDSRKRLTTSSLRLDGTVKHYCGFNDCMILISEEVLISGALKINPNPLHDLQGSIARYHNTPHAPYRGLYTTAIPQEKPCVVNCGIYAS